jgi:WD40 repeat protein/tRNA A-37 threonylcarbamoyl transferase component Bud32
MTIATASWVGLTLAAGRYEVTAKLGEGGMGSVYRARDHHLGCEVVIKVPRRSLLEEAEFAGRFAREIRSLVRLAHPHIVKVTDVGEHDGLPFAVMQYLAGGSLRDRQQVGPEGGFLPLPVGELPGWLPAVASALDFMHEQRYIHRDVKPDNILFDDHGHAYLSDFGIAKVLAGKKQTKQTFQTATGIVLGTPQYMAPELVLGQSYDGRVDQYALAVTVYELLCGRVPFDGPTAVAIFLQQSTQAPPSLMGILPTIPTRVAEAVQRAMAKDPKQRFARCTDFAEALVQGTVGSSESAGALKPDPYPRAMPVAPPPVSTKQFCVACGKAFLVPPVVQGGRVKCPSCGAVVEVTASATASIPGPSVKSSETGGSFQIKFDTDPHRPKASAPAAVAPAQTYLRRPMPSRRPNRSRLIAVGIAAGLVGVLNIALASAWLLKSKSTSATPPAQPALVPAIRAETREPDPSGAAEASPMFALRDIPKELILTPGQSERVRIRVERLGYHAPIQVRLRDLPAAIECQGVKILAEGEEGELKLAVLAGANSATHRARLEARGGDVLLEADIKIRVNRVDSVRVPPPPPVDQPKPLPKIKEMRVGQIVRSFTQKATCVAFSLDGRLAVSGSKNGTLCAWELETGRQLFVVQRHARPVWGVAFSPTANRFASASEDGTVRLWELPGGRQVGRELGGGRAPLLSVGFSTDGRYVFAGCRDGTARVWEEATGTEVHSISVYPKFARSYPKAVNSVALSRDGRWLLTGSGELQGTDESLRLWNFQTEKLERAFQGYTTKVNSLAFSPNSERALSGGADGTLRLWDVASGEQRLSWKAHNGYVHSVAFCPDGQRALSGGIDSVARVWDLTNGSELYCFEGHRKGKGSVFGVAASPDGRHALTASESVGIHLWVLTGYQVTGAP